MGTLVSHRAAGAAPAALARAPARARRSTSRAARARCASRCATTARTAPRRATRRRSRRCGSSARRCSPTRSRSTSPAPSAARRSPTRSRFWHTTTPGLRSTRSPPPGLKLAVVANWDVSLHGRAGAARARGAVRGDRHGGGRRRGEARPEAVPGRARAARRRRRAAACTSGDDPVTDIAGARAAGLAAVLLDRSGRAPDSIATSPSSPRAWRSPHDAAGRARSAPARAGDGPARRRRRRARRDRRSPGSPTRS